jgi:hypothetical protein
MMNWRYSPLEGDFNMAVEVVIEQSLEYAHARGWGHLAQDELAARAVRTAWPDWSEIQALSAVDWVRSVSPSALPIF